MHQYGPGRCITKAQSSYLTMISGTGSHKNTTTAEKHLVFLLAEGKDCPFKSEKYRNKCISDAGARLSESSGANTHSGIGILQRMEAQICCDSKVFKGAFPYK